MTTMRRWLAGLALLGWAAATGPAADAARPPNVVLILADDLGWGDVGFNGRTEWATPHLDKLGAQGTILRRFYTAAVVCAPSRAALLTGKASIHNGVTRNNEDLPARETTIAEALKPLGYRTALFGKWHRGQPRQKGASPGHPMDQGFDEFFGFTDARHAWEQFPSELWHGREIKPVTGYANDLFTDRAVEFLRREAGQDRPFFLYLPYIATHFQIEAPPEEVALHQGKFPEKDPAHPLNATYAAMVTRLDKGVGRVLAALDELKLDGNTIVVFASDHGATFEAGNLGTSNFHDSNRPFRGQKRTLWEGGIRVPGIVRWPGKVPAGAVSEQVVLTTDLLPTLVAAAGGTVDPAWKVDGRDAAPAWTGQGPWPERTVFWEWRDERANQVAAARGPHKLVVVNDGPPELFDVVADPGERRNIAADLPAVVKSLRDELKGWLATEIED